MSPIDIRDRLGDRFRILTSSPRAPQRQQTLRNVVAWSYELLDQDERALLCATAVFAGGFDLAAITEVVGGQDELAVLDLIDSLVRKSLVVADNAAGTGRYVVLETIRQFVEDELTATGLIERNARPARRALRLGGGRALGELERPGVARLRRLVGGRARQPPRRLPVEPGSGRRRGQRPTSPRTPRSWVPRSSAFETVGWAQELLEDATRADVRHLPRLYTGAAWGCFTGRAGRCRRRRSVRGQARGRPALRRPVNRVCRD